MATKLERTTSSIEEAREAQKKVLFEKYAKELSEWIEQYLGIEPLDPDFLATLKDGIILCRLLKKYRPSIESELDSKYKFPPENMKTANVFQSMEFVNCFIVGCHKIGIKPMDIFRAEDLIERVNPLKVVRTLQCFKLLVPELDTESSENTKARHQQQNNKAKIVPQKIEEEPEKEEQSQSSVTMGDAVETITQKADQLAVTVQEEKTTENESKSTTASSGSAPSSSMKQPPVPA